MENFSPTFSTNSLMTLDGSLMELLNLSQPRKGLAGFMFRRVYRMLGKQICLSLTPLRDSDVSFYFNVLRNRVGYLLQRMLAFQILLAAGRFAGRGPLGIWDRIPLRSPIDGSHSQLTWVVLTPATEYTGVQQLPSGQFQFNQFVGITEKEAEYARASGGEELLSLLLKHKAAPITDPNRESIV